ncbi:hypothetical protein F5Y14DRAFT_27830 [Nemania sp. NC0429]|nr:hypothetical protein F5Y14DRAFT_27830 [Nemania sp. NC0429]
MLGEPRQEWPLAYPQPSLPHQAQAWASSATFPLSYGVSQIPTDADSGWAESVPSSTDQYYPSESVSAPQDQTAEMDGAQDEWHRRLSTQAYQGSDSEHPDINYYESVVASPSTSQPVTLGMDNSGDSSGETSPVYRASYVSECMNGEDEPWSTECPRRSGYPHYHPC